METEKTCTPPPNFLVVEMIEGACGGGGFNIPLGIFETFPILYSSSKPYNQGTLAVQTNI